MAQLPTRGDAREEKVSLDASQPLYRDLPAGAARSGSHSAFDVAAFSPPVFRGVPSHSPAWTATEFEPGFGVRGNKGLASSMEPPALHHAPQGKKLELGFGFDPTPISAPIPFGQTLPLSGVVKPPLAIGSYLEPYYHFYSSLDGPAIMRELAEALAACSAGDTIIDTEKFDSKYKIKCVMYSSGGSVCVPFNVRIFSLEDDDRLAVEFQRRSGDSVRFCSLYRKCLQMLQRKGVTDSTVSGSPASLSPMRSPEPMTGPADPQAGEHAAQTIKCLLQMMASDCVDVQTQAAGALADLSTDVQMLEAMIQGGVIEAFVNASRSENCDVHRCAMTGLAHLSANDAAAVKLCQLGGVAVAAKLCSQTKTAHVERESVRLIHNVVQNVGRGIFETDDGENVRGLMQEIENFPPKCPTARHQWNDLQHKLAQRGL